jgi:hypothetical protein
MITKIVALSHRFRSYGTHVWSLSFLLIISVILAPFLRNPGVRF